MLIQEFSVSYFEINIKILNNLKFSLIFSDYVNCIKGTFDESPNLDPKFKEDPIKYSIIFK